MVGNGHVRLSCRSGTVFAPPRSAKGIRRPDLSRHSCDLLSRNGPGSRRGTGRWRGAFHSLQVRECSRWPAECLRKDLLTEVLGAGRDAKIAGLPLDAAQVLRLMCTDLVKPV